MVVGPRGSGGPFVLHGCKGPISRIMDECKVSNDVEKPQKEKAVSPPAAKLPKEKDPKSEMPQKEKAVSPPAVKSPKEKDPKPKSEKPKDPKPNSEKPKDQKPKYEKPKDQKPKYEKPKDLKPKDQKPKIKKQQGRKGISQPAGGDGGPRGPSGDVERKRVPTPMYRAPVQIPGPVLTPMGTVCVVLRCNMRAHVSPAGWVLIVNGNISAMAGVDPEGKRCAMRHPAGSIHQEDARIHMITADGKRASLSPKGITFCSRASTMRVPQDGVKREGQLAYVLDDGGPRTTMASFADFEEDFVVKLIAAGNTGCTKLGCEGLLRKSFRMDVARNTDNWIIGGTRVAQHKSGDCFVIWDNTRCVLKASPDRGTLGIATPSVYATASAPPDPHVFVRNRGRRVHHDGHVLVVRNGSHIAALDAFGDFALL